jgi:aspartate-semialdehyde dehydrogenase
MKTNAARAWRLATPIPEDVAALPVDTCVPGRGPALVFSALDAAAAQEIEPAFARAGHVVVGNARSHRMDPLLSLLIPEVNPEHLGLIAGEEEKIESETQKVHGDLRGDAVLPHPVVVSAHDRPQPRLDVERDGGTTITVGRVRPCPLLGIKCVALGHNTVRGAAGTAILNAELMMAEGPLGGD